jgi:hypothetical protein
VNRKLFKKLILKYWEIFIYLFLYVFRKFNIPITKNDKKVRNLKNIHIGKTAILLGNGPSVKIDDFNHISNYVTFACNRFHLCYDKTNFRPDYTVICDSQMANDFGEEIESCAGGTVVVCLPHNRQLLDKHIFIKQYDRARFFENPMNGLNISGATLLGALQLGYYMGIRRFVLYGVDHDFKFTKNAKASSVLDSAIGNNNHFIDNYRSGKPWCPPETEKIEFGFRKCAELLREQGCFLVNASRKTKLPDIPRASIDDILSGKVTYEN